jgi:TonB family protein
MYLKYFGLREEPFGATPDPRFLFLGQSHREALASLLHGIETGRGFMTLIAPPGMGKTTLLSQLLEETRTYSESAFVFQTQCSRIELLRSLLIDSGVQPRSEDPVMMYWQLSELLLNAERKCRRFIIVIDEAQNLSDEVLESVRLLSNFERPHSKLLQIILSGQPQFGTTLSLPQQQQLQQRMSMICRLHPLSAAEINEYIEFRLDVAGRTRRLFTPGAVSMVADLSCGIPRVVNNCCFNLLSLAFARQQGLITEELVSEVASDLDLGEVAGATGDSPSTRSSTRGRREQSATARPRKLRRSMTSFAALSGRQPTRVETQVKSPNEQTADQKITRSLRKPKRESDVLKLFRGHRAASTEPVCRTEIAGAKQDAKAAASELTVATVKPQPAQAQTVSAATSPLLHQRKWIVLLFLFLCFAIGVASYGWKVYRVRTAATAPLPPAAPNVRAEVVPNLALDSKSSFATRRLKQPSQKASSELQVRTTGDLPRSKANSVPEAPPASISLNLPPMPALTVPNTVPGPAAKALTVIPAKLIHEVAPKYPNGASGPGEVQLTALINERGEVSDVKLESGSNVLLSAAASAAVHQWRYSPAIVNGKAVETTARIVVRFRR